MGVCFVFINDYFSYFDNSISKQYNSSTEILEKEKKVDSFLREGISLLHVVYSHKTFSNYLKTTTSIESKNDVISMFKIVANANPNILKIVYIDSSGMERIKIDKKFEGVIYRDDFENKNMKFYFQNAKKTQKPFFSTVELITDDGVIEEPIRPTIRAIMPLYDGSKFKGALVLSLNVSNLLETFSESPLFKFVLFDYDGFTMYHYSPSKAWGNSFSHKYNIKHQFDDASMRLHQTGIVIDGEVSSKLLDLSFPVQNGIGLIVEFSNLYTQRISEKNFHHVMMLIISFLLGIAIPAIVIRKYWKTVSLIEEMSVYNNHLEQEKDNLQEFVHKDALTGIYNIKKFDSVFHSLISNYLDTKKSFSLMILDIDGFKKINDTYSYKTANNVIKGVVENINLLMRENYTFIRYCGVKFVIFLPNTRLRNAVVLAEKIRTSVENMDRSFDGAYIDVTVSVGVDSFQKNDFDATFFERVQSYTDKAISEGGNKVVFNIEKYKLSKGAI